MVEKRRLGGALIIEDDILNVKVEYIMVDMVPPPVEGEAQGQVLE